MRSLLEETDLPLVYFRAKQANHALVVEGWLPVAHAPGNRPADALIHHAARSCPFFSRKIF